jgi:hypothetical protein
MAVLTHSGVWTLYWKGAKNHDEARNQTSKVDMDLLSFWFSPRFAFNFTFMFAVEYSSIDDGSNAIFARTLDAIERPHSGVV